MTKPSETVFHDPTGRRARGVVRVLAALGALTAIFATLFALSLIAAPLLPNLDAFSSLRHQVRPVTHGLPGRSARLDRFLLRRSREKLWREIDATERRIGEKRKAHKPAAQGAPIRAAFYATWQETGLESLRTNAGRLTHVLPQWLRLDPSGRTLDLDDFDPARVPHNRDVISISREHAIEIDPMLTNASGDGFDPARVHKLLASIDAQDRFVGSIADLLVEQQLDGLNLDFENLEAGDYKKLGGFVERLAKALHAKVSSRGRPLALSVDVEAEDTRVPLAAISKSADFIVLMTYDEHWAGGDPGPIASLPWFAALLEKTLSHVPPAKLVVGIGNYAYDWRKTSSGEKRVQAESLSYGQALILARSARSEDPPKDVIEFDGEALNSHFDYEDEDGAEHVVWMLDAPSAYDEWKTIEKLELGGAALWVMGSEDPGLWSFFDRQVAKAPPPDALGAIHGPAEIQYEGKGEILSLRATPSDGVRKVVVGDPETGLITEVEYSSFPTSYVIERAGHRAGRIALTFDDGPDPKYTPQILDVLKREGVRATFFVIGEEAERYPQLIRRIYSEGHEIGSHTFTHPNLAAVSADRETLELNATQRAIEAVLARSTILFRPPYAADAEPRSAEEVAPIVRAAQHGYLTVGELIDPQDWRLDDSGVPRTAEAIASEVIAQAKSADANVVLLHDGGGDRSRTVEALTQIIASMRREGRALVTTSDLLGKTRDDVMPAVQSREALLVGADRVVFEAIYVVETVLSYAFFTAIILGVGRILLLLPLALVGWRKERKRFSGPSKIGPPVSVLIAAYNEQPVIARTIESVLRSDRPIEEVIVVDDGSKDGTGDEVERHFASEPRVRLVRQQNAGKAAALNRAIELSNGSVLVCLDADTQFAPDTIRLLARHFEDPKVGAVAGNVKVGNRVNLFTRWQAIEYITSQNLDRRGFAVLNAVTVVPGAVGAWRREAVISAGGYRTDTLAEDMDLTFRLQRAGWRIDTDTAAEAYTEAPDTFAAFFKQRFRWSYGTLQCLAKHRGALFRHGFFGVVALPAMWIFQFVFQLLAPLVDLQLLYAVGRFAMVWITQGVLRQDWQPLPGATETLMQTAFFYALFFAVELLGAVLAFRLDRERIRLLVWLFWQRFGYRQLMYAVGIKAVFRAVHGMRQGWGKLDRKGTVEMPKS